MEKQKESEIEIYKSKYEDLLNKMNEEQKIDEYD